jgi:hypothetical protein
MIILPVFSFASQEPKYALDVKTLISKIIEAYGGKETIESIENVYAKGKINALMRKDKGEYYIYFKRDRKLRSEILYSRSPEIRILNGSRGWRGTGKGPLPEVSNNRYLAMAFQHKRLDLPYGLLTNAYKIKQAGSGFINGKNVSVLELTDSEGPQMKIYIDSENFHIVKVSGYFSMGQSTTELSAEYSNFRTINGTPFPYKIINYAGGHKVGETIIEKYSVNSAMDVSLFKP